MEANATIMDHAACASWYAGEGVLTNEIICTTNTGGGVCNVRIHVQPEDRLLITNIAYYFLFHLNRSLLLSMETKKNKKKKFGHPFSGNRAASCLFQFFFGQPV
jgi:hypothetical protein